MLLMLRYYLLIIAGSVIDDDTLYFKISVGDNKADQMNVHVLKVLAAENGWYFSQYDHKTSDFLLQIALSQAMMPDDLEIRQMKLQKFLHAWLTFCKANNFPKKDAARSPVSNHQAHRKPIFSQVSVLRHAESVTRSKPKFLLQDFKRYLTSKL